MKSFNQFLCEAEDLTPERQKLNLGVSPGQQSLPGMGKKKDKPTKPVTPAKGSEYLDPKTGQASDEGIRRYMNKRNTKGYFRTEGKPSAVTPEDVKAGLEKTKADMQNPEEVQKVRDKINQKYGKPQTVSVPAKPRKPADDAFAKKLELDTPQGAAAAQDAARAMAADAKKGQTNLKGGPTPQVKPTKAVKPAAPPAPTAAQVRPRGQGSRPVGSTTTRGGAPQLPTLGAKSKPTPVTPAKSPIAKKPVVAKPPELPKIDPETQAPTTKPKPGANVDIPPSQGMTSTKSGSATYKPPTKAERALANRTKATRVVGQIARPLAGATSIATGYQAGQARGEGPLTSFGRGVTRAAGGALASTVAGGAALKRLKPGLAVPAAAAAYPAGEMAADKLFNRVKGILKNR